MFPHGGGPVHICPALRAYYGGRKVRFMSDVLNEIRQMLLQHKGCRVRLRAIGDRNRVTAAEGILDGVYPDVFTILVEMGGYDHRYSYTYREIFTKRVEVEPLERAR